MRTGEATVATDYDLLEEYGFTSGGLITMRSIGSVEDLKERVVNAIRNDKRIDDQRRHSLIEKVTARCTRAIKAIQEQAVDSRPPRSSRLRGRPQPALAT